MGNSQINGMSSDGLFAFQAYPSPALLAVESPESFSRLRRELAFLAETETEKLTGHMTRVYKAMIFALLHASSSKGKVDLVELSMRLHKSNPHFNPEDFRDAWLEAAEALGIQF